MKFNVLTSLSQPDCCFLSPSGTCGKGWAWPTPTPPGEWFLTGMHDLHRLKALYNKPIWWESPAIISKSSLCMEVGYPVSYNDPGAVYKGSRLVTCIQTEGWAQQWGWHPILTLTILMREAVNKEASLVSSPNLDHAVSFQFIGF